MARSELCESSKWRGRPSFFDPADQRYCINSISLRPAPAEAPSA
ncbi:peptide-methionine (R)-S-oxide reductase [Streptomyces sp. ISL-94]|nr:peptide-methionine (R)-S-oxide reductase [Streptomyces sp. ISL-94]